jgi:hypothetical protein
MISSLALAVVLAAARYPGDAPLASASRRFTVANEDHAEASRAGNRHVLYVVEKTSGARRPLLEYPREVTVTWAPDREALAVTNHVGSTQTTLSVFVLEQDAFRKVDVAEALFTAFPSLRGELAQYLHVHVELVAWRRDGVECRLRASAGTGPNIARRYAVSADGRAKRI